MKIIKILFIIIFLKLLFPYVSFAQLDGHYVPFTEDNLLIVELERFEFSKNLFKYFWYTDIDWSYGQGDFVIKNNQIILTFKEQLDTF